MVADGIEAKKLAVQGMRQPRQRVPVSGAKGRERPLHGVPGQAALNLGISQDVYGVVKIGESILNDGIVERERDRHQQQAEDDDALFAGRWHVHVEWRRLRWRLV